MTGVSPPGSRAPTPTGAVTTPLVNEFLPDYDGRVLPWARPTGGPTTLDTDRILFGEGENALEVALAHAVRDSARPTAESLRALWKKRHADRPSPVLLVALYRSDVVGQSLAAVVGPTGDPSPIVDLSTGQVAQIAAAALDEPDRHSATRTLERLLAGLKDHLTPGLVNSGLFASHELRSGVPQRSDWSNARDAAQPLLGLQGMPLVQALGYDTAPRGSVALLMTHRGTSRAIAVLLDATDVFDRPSVRFGAVSPVAHGLAIASREGLPWLMVLRGTQIRLYPARPEVGVGRKGQAETYTELDLTLLSNDEAAYLTLLFGSDALAPGGTVEQILAASANFAADLGKRLRERIYDDVIPGLALAIAARTNPATDQELTKAYHLSLLVLFRLLFLAYAEDRGLLPYGRNPRYDRHAVKTLARDFADNPHLRFDEHATSLWDDIQTVWNAVDEGNRGWDVPAYNGGLFSRDPDTNPSGAALATMRLTDAEFGPGLRSLLVDIGEDGTQGPVDFRSLSVREFGTIYEGLLESNLSIAPSNLTVDTNGTYLPAKPGAEIVVSAGQVYIHNKSGARKSTGSYFTKQFAVEHLLDSALEPALSAHLARVKVLVNAKDYAGAADAFFDFRVVDLAMGSAHFLVAAIDRIEARFTAFLAEHYPIPAIIDELNRLDQAARTALGNQAADVEIETGALLRRQIARRCVYGLDLNLMAVELARLAVWIHTFVPGLPMSALNHCLVVGNSLTGIATLDEVLKVLDPQRRPNDVSLFAADIEVGLHSAQVSLRRVAATAEATKQEVIHTARAYAAALEQARDAKLLCDAAVAVRLGLIPLPLDSNAAVKAVSAGSVQAEIRQLQAVHLPVQFPEVFLRQRPGFDVVLGNPPWDKVRWEAAPFWVGIYPGLMALRDAARNKKINELRLTHPIEAAHEQQQRAIRSVQQNLFKKAYMLRGGTHLEFAQLMLERAIRVQRPKGHLGLVLPRQSMVLAGWKNLRRHMVGLGNLGIVQGRNHCEWIFDGIHASYAVALLSAGPSEKPTVRVGIARSPADVVAMTHAKMVRFTPTELANLSDMNVVPWFNEPDDRRVFDIIRQHPRLASEDGWITARHDARWDFTASGPDRALPIRENAPGSWQILMTAHVDQFAFDMTVQFKQFIADLRGVVGKCRGVAVRNGRYVVTDEHPVILIRRPSNCDNSRTLIATALPESGLLHNKGSVHAVMHSPSTSEEKRLALLALLNTLTADWWVRRFVDRHVTAPVINNLRLPDWSDAEISEAAGIASTLLARSGATILAGGISVEDARPESELCLRARLEQLALRGYGLDAGDIDVIAADFNATGMPNELRTMLRVIEVSNR